MIKNAFRRLLGWAANFYPNNVFYARHFMPELKFKGGSGPAHDSDGNTALLAVAVAAGRQIEVGGRLEAAFGAVTDGGEEIGDFIITVERIA